MSTFIKFLALLTCSVYIASANAEQEEDFWTGKTVQNGMINIAYDDKDDTVYLQLQKQQINTVFIFQSSLPHGIGSNDIGLDRGQLGETRLVQFTRFGNKLLLKQMNTEYRAMTSNKAERKSIDEAFADSVLAGFEIVDETENTVTVNYRDFLYSDIHGISTRLSQSGQGAYSPDKTRSGVFLARTKTFEQNTELEALVTFGGSSKGAFIEQVTPDADSVTVHLHHSYIALPDDKYKPRQFHPYSGFWKHSYLDYSVPIESNMEKKFIPRHRLVKVNPGASVSEAVKPIVYYLDPGIPDPIMSALKEGALWWDQAFAAAGYKNAFQVKVLPQDADPMDVRYNVIQWVHRATRGWSYGSSIIDPRTGEIIKGHVTLGSLRVRQDFLIATGFTAPYSESDGLVDTSNELSMALERIKQLSAHEVGHTLGLAHNFAASENDRASVMDYPHPLIALNNGKIDLSNAYAQGIGDWDKYTIAFGYQDFTGNTNETEALKNLVMNAVKTGYLYKSDPDARITKRASANGHLWDNGSDPIAEFKRVSELRKFAINQFGSNNLPANDDFSDLERRLVPIYYSHRYQLNALVKQISGLNYAYTVKQNGETPNVTFVNGKIQSQALSLVLDSASAEYLRLPASLTLSIPPHAYGSNRTRESMPTRMGIAFDPITAAESVAAYSVNILLQSERLNRLAFQHSQQNDIPSVTKLTESLFTILIKNNDSDRLASRIKLVALSAFFNTINDSELSADVKLEMQKVLLDYQNWLKKNERKLSNRVLLKHIDYYWQHNQWPMLLTVKPMPPGSPI